jgi:hypothetical protein
VSAISSTIVTIHDHFLIVSGDWKHEHSNNSHDFFDFPVSASSQPEVNRICVESCLISDLKYFNFFHLEFLRTSEKYSPQFGVNDVRNTKVGSVTADVCVAVIGNSKTSRKQRT